MKKPIVLAGLLLIAISWVALLMVSAPRRISPSVGSEVTLSAGGGSSQRVAVATNADSLPELRSALQINDWRGLLEMFRTGKAFGVSNGTRAMLLEIGISKRRVRIIEGPMEGKAGWVPTAFVNSGS